MTDDRPVTVDLPDLLRDAPRYRSTAVVRAARITGTHEWRTRRGSDLAAAAGDWLLTDGSHEWTVADAVFGRTYRRCPDGSFTKVAEVRAVQVARRLVVPTLEGDSTAEPGDWVLSGVDDELWPVTDRHFREHYRPV